MAKKGIVKQEELDWTGVNDWLKEQKGTVDKNTLLEKLQENNIKVDEIVEFHDYVVRLAVEAKEEWSTVPYNFSEEVIHNFEQNGVVFKLLTSEKELSIEGKKMHHCVEMYHNQCAAGRYLVYHITHKLIGKEATLGLVPEIYRDWETS